MKLVHRQTKFAQVDVKVHHHVPRHRRGEHFLSAEGVEEGRKRSNSMRRHST